MRNESINNQGGQAKKLQILTINSPSAVAVSLAPKLMQTLSSTLSK